jgi:signal transduction histidine kinase
MNRLIEQLGDSGRRPADVAVDLAAVLQRAAERCSDREPAPMPGPLSDAQVRADPERLASVIEHVIRNAQDACSPTDHVTIRLRVQDNRAVISIADTGPGMSQEFVRERLFRPFDSTKGSKGMGIGAYQAREYVRSLGGDVEVQSSAGSGTCFDINLPLMPTLSPQPAADGGSASDANGRDLQPAPRMT